MTTRSVRLGEGLRPDGERAALGIDVEKRGGLLAAERGEALPDLGQVAGHEQHHFETRDGLLREVLGQARHGEQIDTLMGQGVQVLIPPDANKRRGTRPGWDGGRYAFMRAVLDTVAGAEFYARRQHMIEPIFADTKCNRRADRFLRRGRAAARSEWRLLTATGNLLKLWRHANAPALA